MTQVKTLQIKRHLKKQKSRSSETGNDTPMHSQAVNNGNKAYPIAVRNGNKDD